MIEDGIYSMVDSVDLEDNIDSIPKHIKRKIKLRKIVLVLIFPQNLQYKCLMGIFSKSTKNSKNFAKFRENNRRRN